MAEKRDAISVDLSSTAEERFISYALSVITSRALPDVRDGLKPVQRRILYAMYQNLRLTAGARARKSAAVVGEVLGKYHPHGDQAAYEAMVRMAQPFALRYPLVHGEGNFGSLDGDGAAAMRYTEARLTAIAEELLRDIRHDTVDFRDNYDATLREPIVLPAALPQLLVNGSTGIAVGMATNIPPHNLREVVEALVALVADPGLQTKDLLKYIKGPDFPTGGEILNTKAELRQIYETGQGPVRVRAQYKLEKIGRREAVVVTSIPYTTNKASLVEEIAEHILSRKLPLAVDVRDESTDDVRVVVELKPEASADAVMAYLFKHTSLQLNFNVNLTALVPTGHAGVGQPARLTLLELCRHFLDFRRDIVRRRLTHELGELRARLHILEGFLKLFDGVDKAIKIIRGAESRPDAQRGLMKAFDLDEVQADAILDTRLYQLARLEIDKIREEQREKAARAKEIERLLKSDRALWNLVSTELRQVATDYGDARRTVLKAGAELTYDAEAYVVHEDATVVVTRDGWMKRVGEIKDPSSTRVREGDQAKWILRGNTRDSLALFSSSGIAYVMKVTNVPATTGYGEPVQSLLNFKDRERIVAAVLLRAAADREETPRKAGQGELFSGEAAPAEAASVLLAGAEQAVPVDRWLVATAAGMGFFSRPDLSETTRSGRRFARTKDDDALVTVAPAAGDVITAVSAGGKVLSFPAEELPELAGAGRGVILMRLDEDESLIGAVCHAAARAPIAVGDDGSERKISLPELAHRAQKGRKALKRITVVDLR
ncbi:MAG TPA: DNA topoisomerase IV subunit A [Candidatus Dormibacteraeota bacterium]|nr:DNA topoisomerase IV subunit A [Candidatus Dormibacteraeota bacterium]